MEHARKSDRMGYTLAQLVTRKTEAESPTDAMLKDAPFLVNARSVGTRGRADHLLHVAASSARHGH